MLHLTVPLAESIARDIGYLAGGVGTLYASVRGMPILAAFVDKIRIARERDNALERAAQAESAAKGYELAANSWQSALEGVKAELSELRSEVQASNRQLAETMDELHRVKALLAQSIVYITGWHTFMRLGGNPPEMPAELKFEIDAIQNRDNQSQP